MKLPAEMQQDTQFGRLVRRESGVDLTVAALEIARDAQPGLDFAPTLEWLRGITRQLRAKTVTLRDSDQLLATLAQELSVVAGLGGTDRSFDRPESSFLNRVIESREGIPISLSLIYMAIANPLGIELQAVAAPVHFLTRHESAAGVQFVDAFAGGRVMDYSTCVRWLMEVAGISSEQARIALRPADDRTVIVRMLNNLKSLYVGREDWRSLWRVQQRLQLLSPASYDERRDLALVAVKSRRPALAVDLLTRLIPGSPESDREMLAAHLQEAHRVLAAWN